MKKGEKGGAAEQQQPQKGGKEDSNRNKSRNARGKKSKKSVKSSSRADAAPSSSSSAKNQQQPQQHQQHNRQFVAQASSIPLPPRAVKSVGGSFRQAFPQPLLAMEFDGMGKNADGLKSHLRLTKEGDYIEGSSNGIINSAPKVAAAPKKPMILKRQPSPARSTGRSERNETLPQNQNKPQILKNLSKDEPIRAKQVQASKNQRNAYYNNVGVLPSSQNFQDSIQHKLNEFPISKNEPIMIANKYHLMISSTSTRIGGLSIRVRPQSGDDSLQVSALIPANSNDQTIRNACHECLTIFDNSSSQRKNERAPFSECSEEFLKSVYIRKLEEPQDAFPDAIYYCNKCEYHISSITHARNHLEMSTHFDDVERQEQRHELISKVPDASESHVKSLSKVLKGALTEYQSQKKKNVKDVTESLIYFLKLTIFPEMGYGDSSVELAVFGSTIYECELEDSDINVAFLIPNLGSSQLFEVLNSVLECLKKNNIPAEMSSDGSSNSSIVFTYEGIPVRLCHNSAAVYRSQVPISHLLKTYVSLRPEIVKFMQLIRLWATKVGVDSKNKPKLGLPRYGFDIMAIHYLQQIGMIPVLHELYEDADDSSSHIHHDDDEDARTTCSNRTQVEVASETRFRLAMRYETDREKIGSKFDLGKKWDISRLWIGFFKYYVEKHRDGVVQITQIAPMTKDTTKWNRKTFHIVDPFRSDNVLAIPKVSSWMPFFFNCLLSTYVHYAIPRNEQGAIVDIELYQIPRVPKNRVNRRGGALKVVLPDELETLDRLAEHTASPKKKATKSENKVASSSNRPPPKSPVKARLGSFFESDIDDASYNAKADAVAEDADIEEHSRRIAEKLKFDGISLLSLTGCDVEIDEHRDCVYSRKTLQRFRRKYRAANEHDVWRVLEEKEMLSAKKGKRIRNKLKQLEAAVEEQVASETVEPVSTRETEEPKTTPPMESQWQYWNEHVINKKRFEVEHHDVWEVDPELEKHFEQVSLDEKMPNVEPKPKPEPKPEPKKIEFGEFPASTFNKSNTDVRVKNGAAEKVCTEEFFIRMAFVQQDIVKMVKEMCSEEFVFGFEEKDFSYGYMMETKCSSCDGHHYVEDCPTLKVPPIEFCRKRTKDEIRQLDDMIDDYYHQHIISEERLGMLKAEVGKLERYLRDKYESKVKLTIFGSVMTGIGQSGSDIDICLRFDDSDEPPKEYDPVKVIIAVAGKLKKCQLTQHVNAITTAKVPIVKFQIRLSGTSQWIDADISYYNILAIYNTSLLKQYCLWTPEEQFAKLGLFIKHWAKSCDIGEASKGSISSYAYIVLLISYLQQCDPPVIPRLQEDFRNNNTQKRLIEGWDTYFYECNELPKSWPKNQQSCGELLIGFFDYYAAFKYRDFVIQCRRESPLSKLEKEWTGKALCIEDPFDLHHNLGAGVTKKMFAFIHRNFICSRKTFMSSDACKAIQGGPTFSMEYRLALLKECSQGHAPTDRQCHMCGKIGHFAEGCPKRYEKENRRRRRNGSTSTNASFRGGMDGNWNGDKKDEVKAVKYSKRNFRR